MSFTIQNYQNTVREILDIIGVCRTKQLINCLKKKYENLNDQEALEILQGLQRNRYLLLSQDGWVMTVGAYMQLANDKFFDKTITSPTEFAIPYDINQILNVNKNIVNSMWIVADMYPNSKNFVLSNSPWDICFTTPASKNKKGRLFQIMTIAKGEETSKIEMIKNLPEVSSESFREVIRRIAIIEDEKLSWMVPHLGFAFVCAIDEKSPVGYKILEKRTEEEVWSDYVNKE